MDSISRHEQLLRVFHLIDMLFGARRPMTIAEIKAGLRDRGVIDEMSDKNIRRDVDFLGKFGYAVKRTRVRTPRGTAAHAWSIVPGRGRGELSSPAVSLPELLSLLVAREFLVPLAGTFYWRGIGQLLAKVEAIATPELRDYVAAHKDGLVVHPPRSGGKYGPRLLTAINRAILGSLELGLRYQGLADEKPRRIVIRPEALVIYDGSVYIAAYRVPGKSGRDDEAIRFFKLDRVLDAKPSAKTFTRRGIPVETLLADSITLFRSPDRPRAYRLRIGSARARWAEERPFHPRQRIEDRDDGGIIVAIDRAHDEEMIPQLLALGEHVEVIEPEDVRDRLLDEARRIAAKYMCRHLRSFEDTYVSQ
ncbi:MAG: WYL domain-containing protein [Planctomycetia bacterium]|nr:WYL domain-containing protein [Planctomycetia bacterium]